MGQKIAGTCYVKVDGQQLVLTGAVEAPLNKSTRETVVKGYFKEEDTVPFVKAEVAVPKGTNMAAITGATNATVTVEFANGSVYTLSGAYLVGEVNYSSDEGKASLEWNGTEGDWN